VGSVPGQQSAAPYIYPANALWVFDGNYGAPRPAVRDEFVAWPPPGYVPHTVVYSRWSLSYPGANFSKASVSLTRLGKSVATTIEPVLDGSGENTIVWQLDGVAPNSSLPKPTADDTYTVTVANVSIGGAARAFTYAVTVFDPAVPTPGAAQTSVSVPAEVALAAKFQLAVVPMNNATQYSVLRFRRQALAGKRFNTSNAAGDWSSGSGIALDATAGPTFRLSNQSNAREQAIVLNKQLLVGSTGRVSLTRSMLLATTQEQFHLQLSSDGGATWNDVYSERGIAQLGPTSRIQADLSAFAGRPVQFRMLLSPGASYYVCSGCGWALSDIDFEGVDELLDEQGFTVPAASARLETSIQKPGSYVLFGRTQYQSRYDSAFGKGAYLEVTGVLLTGKRSNYTIITTTDGVVITDNVGGDGVQRVRNPFRLDFTDVTVAYDLSGNAGRAYRLYRAALNRPPDAGGLGFWIKALDNGATLDQMAAGFTSSSEFKLLYGASPTHAQLIEAAYNNVLHRVPDAAGAAYWVGALAGSLSTEAMLAYFSESAENQQQVAAAIASGIEYVRY